MPTAVVTGAGRGIGAEVARELAADGWGVFAVVRDPAAARTTFDGVPAVQVISADISSAAEIESAARAVATMTASVDLLVANAAQFAPWDETVATADLDLVRDILAVNVVGTWQTIRAFLPARRAAGNARIVIVGSGGGSHGDLQFGIATHPGAASYAVSKAAVHALARKAALELGEDGIDVFAVDPGLTATAPGMAEMGARPPRDGARSVLAPILHPGSVERGSLTRDGCPLPW